MTTQAFIFEEPLYKKVGLSDNPHVLDELMGRISIDGYNVQKGTDSTFQLRNSLYSSFEYSNSTEQITFICQRYGDPLYVQIHYDRKQGFIEKVGQFPSVADIHIAQIKQYRKVLGESYIKDFTKAIGLAANGVGTGSFVYLRRVFEHLVHEIAEEAITNGDVERATFESSKMDNKLKLLSSYLPDVIMENKSLYGVLSAGIHTLSEEDCLSHFSVVKSIIELILDEKEHERLIMEKKKEARDKLALIAGEVKKTTK